MEIVFKEMIGNDKDSYLNEENYEKQSIKNLKKLTDLSKYQDNLIFVQNNIRSFDTYIGSQTFPFTSFPYYT